jgi:hypothetical protein
MNKIVDNKVDPEYQWLTKKQVYYFPNRVRVDNH